MTLTTADFPLRPIGRGETAVQVFQSAAEQSAGGSFADDDDSEAPGGPRRLTTLQGRLLQFPDRPVRLGRYEVRRCIGAGGMGVVYEAIDVEHGQRVALKTLQQLTGAALQRFKNEFRAMADLVHENLVALHELCAADGEWFLTMDYIEGIRIVDYVRVDDPSPHAHGYLGETFTVDDPDADDDEVPQRRSRISVEPAPATGTFHEGRLRAAFLQLATGLSALHDAGRLHRDLNSSNVLVTREGRVVVLDFGLVTDVRPRPAWFDGISGTPGYMSPEQAVTQPVTPASDWYGFGVMLFEALTGQLPFTGSATRMLAAKLEQDAPAPSSRAPGVPADLDALCVALLRRLPAGRPAAAEVRRVLAGSGEPRADATTPAAWGPLVGRAAEQAALDAAFESTAEATTIVHLVGPPGIGKTALLDAFVERLAGSALILRGRCHERESIPLRALDGVVDALAEHLRGLPPAEARAILGPGGPELAALFPVLSGTADLEDPGRPAEPEGVFALASVLARLAGAGPLVVAIDDFHWTDPESARFLADLVAGPQRILVVLAYWDEGVDPPPALADLARAAGARTVAVGPIPLGAALELASRHDAGLASALVAESAGNPAMLLDLAANGEVSFADLVAARLASLPASARRTAEILAVAGRPLDTGIALAAAGAGPEAFTVLARLRAARLAHTLGRALECHGERTRAAILAGLSPDAVRDLHGLLGRALAERPDVDPFAVVRHLELAGVPRLAGAIAARAAAEASAARAPDRAAALYALALSHQVDDAETIRVALADALAAAGRPSEAAAAYLRGAALAPHREALDLRRRAAEQLLVGGRADAGVVVLRGVLDARGIGFPASPRGALLGLLARLARLAVRGTAARRGAASDPDRIELFWSAGKGLASIDPVRSGPFMVDALLWALDGGNPRQLARALAFVGSLLVYDGHPAQVDRGNALIDEAAAIAGRTGDPYLVGLSWCCSGLSRLCTGRWREALSRFDEGLRILHDRCDGVTWETHAYRTACLRALLALGALRELARRTAAWLVEAREKADHFGEVEATLHGGFALIAAGETARARTDAGAALGGWYSSGVSLQHILALQVQTWCDLHDGDAASAWARLEAQWPALADSQLLRIAPVRVDALHLRATAALALAAAARRNNRTLLRVAETSAAELERERRPHAGASAALVRAGVARLRGDLTLAIAELGAAARAYDASEMSLHAESARRQLGTLLGGDQGRALVAKADAALKGEGVRDPARWAGMITGLTRW